MRPPVSRMENAQLLRLMREKLLVHQFVDAPFVRFALVGFSNLIVSFGIFRLCIALPVFFLLRSRRHNLCSYVVGMLWSFCWNRRVTFKSAGAVSRQAVRFFGLQILLAVSSASLIGGLLSASWAPRSRPDGCRNGHCYSGELPALQVVGLRIRHGHGELTCTA